MQSLSLEISKCEPNPPDCKADQNRSNRERNGRAADIVRAEPNKRHGVKQNEP
jgi:hypothetical protein